MWDITYSLRVTLTVVLACVASLMIVLVAVSFRRKEQKRQTERLIAPLPASPASGVTKRTSLTNPHTYR
jgi:hypothetical protein